MKSVLSHCAFVCALILCSWGHAQQISRPVTVEYFQGPVVSSNRIIGMGGAFIGVAEGADGHFINPASFATRYSYAADDWFDYDWALSWVTMPGGQNAALNRSPVEVDVDRAMYLELGFDVKFGRFGIGVHGAPHQFDEYFAWEADDGTTRIEQVTWVQSAGGSGLGYAFGDGQFVVGTALQAVDLHLEGLNLEADETFSVTNTQLLVGGLLALHDQPWRVGARFRTAALGDSEIVGDVEQFQLALEPTRVVAPWQVGVGASWWWGERAYNPRYGFDEESAAGEKTSGGEVGDRRYLLAAADLLITGATDEAIGIESFLSQRYRRAGQNITVGMRAGAESEVISDRLRLRAGSYFEPSRYERVDGRIHGTAGADLHVHLYWDWRLNAALDVADGYLNYGLGVGFWH